MYKKEQVKRVEAKDGEIVVITTPRGRIEIPIGPDRFAPEAEFRVLLERKLQVSAAGVGEEYGYEADRWKYVFSA